MKADEILKKFDLKVTRPREMIYEILESLSGGVDAEFIKDEAEKRGLFINLSTVYRTLELYEDLGMVEKYNLGENRYKYLLKKDNHVHRIICDMCHKDMEIECPMVKIEEFIKNETGFQVMEHHLELKGICRECSEKLKKEQPE